MKKLVVAALVALTLVGCKGAKEIVREVPVYVHDTTQIMKEVHDSTYIDRWHTRYVKGDTIYLSDSIYVVRYTYKTDTAYKYIEKPVVVTDTIVREVKKPLTWWQKTQKGGFWVLLAAIGLSLVWKYRKQIFGL